jgi:hypothetical protein
MAGRPRKLDFPEDMAVSEVSQWQVFSPSDLNLPVASPPILTPASHHLEGDYASEVGQIVTVHAASLELRTE